MRANGVDLLLRFEWAAAAIAALACYPASGGSWWLFAALILAPDLAMLGYLAGPKVGAAAHNLVHLLVWPSALCAFGILLGGGALLQVGLIWLVHIAVDRTLGYGLKLPTGFRDTHLGRIGGMRTKRSSSGSYQF